LFAARTSLREDSPNILSRKAQSKSLNVSAHKHEDGGSLTETNKIGAVVVGGDFQGLEIVRSLGRRGIPVCIIDDEYSVGRFSRYASCFVKAPTLRDERKTTDFLIETARQKNWAGWVLYPTRDELVATISRHKSELEQYFRIPTPDWNVIQWAWNKWNTHCLATKLGIPAPKTWCPQNLEELESIDTEFPLCVKPAVKENFFYATKAKAWRANNREELKALFQRASNIVASNEVTSVGSSQILIQEIIPGGGESQFSSCIFIKDGNSIASMEAQRCRQHPPEFGRAATFVQTIDLPEIKEMSLRFLQGMNYYGLSEIEFKRDPRDGKYKILDVNARTWGFHSLGPAAGVDFAYLLFADQVGSAIESTRGRAGVGWMRMVTDLPTSALGLLKGRLSLRTYLRSLKDTRVESVFSSDDLWPSFMELASLPYFAIKKGY
jgi:predicted ATP-grasp superfamily ATP-dependent carboligase